MRPKFTRRNALSSLGIWAAGSPLLEAQEFEGPRLQGEPPGRITPLNETVNAFEIEAAAERKLSSTVFSAIAGGDRQAFERIVFRPRRFINPQPIDLTVELFGEKLYTPIIVGPVAHQQDYHAEGEVALARGASASKTPVVISDRSSQPIEKITVQAKAGSWYQVYPEADMGPVLARVQKAAAAGCKAICITVGTPYRPLGAGGAPNPAKLVADGDPRISWAVIDQVRQAAKCPVVLKGIMHPDEARAAAEKGVDGIIVSNHAGMFLPGVAAPIEVLASVVDAVSGRIPVLVDGSFRRGSDVVKALAFGAKGVLVARPAMWGLAAYGSDGVQRVLDLMIGEAFRMMSSNSRPTVSLLDRTMLHIDKQ
jgi:4-hydroxymandelate oxidase